MCPGVRRKERRRSACPSGFREGCGVLELMEHPLSSPSPPATATQKHSPISPDVSWEQSRTGTPQLEIRQQFIASYGPGLVCLLHPHTHQHTTFLSFREHVNTRLSIFSSVQEFWSEQVAACKLKCGAPRSPPVLQHMIDSLLLFSFLSLPLPPVFSFLSLYRSSELRLWDLDYGSS